jgi:hypothetical protein
MIPLTEEETVRPSAKTSNEGNFFPGLPSWELGLRKSPHFPRCEPVPSYRLSEVGTTHVKEGRGAHFPAKVPGGSWAIKASLLGGCVSLGLHPHPSPLHLIKLIYWCWGADPSPLSVRLALPLSCSPSLSSPF